MSLVEFHNSLSQHFSTLRNNREAINGTVFALEHGLDSKQRESLKQAIHNHLQTKQPDENNWLPWVVYAVEIGYEFDGHEYWQSFENKTPDWCNNGNRHFIRDGFKKFVQLFGGYRPSGVWANHFNIISYPITHALLPRDLQYQLARVLFNLRSYINRTLIQSPQLLGRKIAENCYDETKRFQQFAQNHDLIGLIAREILTIDEKGSDNVILLPTFKRIIGDLRETSEARVWLDETKSEITSRTYTKGRSGKTLKPQIILRRIEKCNWDVLLDIPDFEPLAESSEEIENFLKSARPRLTGNLGGKRLARGRLIKYGSFSEKLESFPENDHQLLNFRRDLPKVLENFFKREFVIDLPEYTIFTVQEGGFAQQHESRVVNPEGNYIIMCREPVKDNSLLSPLVSSCKKVHLYSLSSNKLTDTQHREFLKHLEVKIETNFSLTPVGTPPISWDEGYKVEYIDGETPHFAIKINQPWTAVRIQLEDFDELKINNQTTSGYVFFSLPPLSTGLYKVSYSIKNELDSDFQSLGEISIYVKDRTIWQPGTTNQNAMLLLPDPPKPNYEQFFNGNVNFQIYSPETSVEVSLYLLSKQLDLPPLLKRNIVTGILPQDVDEINRKINEIVEDAKVLEISEEAYFCRLEFKSEELGSIPFDFRREFNPIQWEVKSNSSGKTILNLSEETFGDEETKIFHYKFESPDQVSELEYDRHFPDHIVQDSGGLFVASTPKQKKGIIVLRANEIKSYRSFSEIGKGSDFTLNLQSYTRTKENLSKLIDLYCLWKTSRTVGSVFSKKDVQKVLDTILFKAVCLIDDNNWKKLEPQYCQNFSNNYSKESIIKSVSPKSSIQTELSKLNIFGLPTYELVEILTSIYKSEVTAEKIVKKSKSNSIRSIIKPIKQDWFTEFALRLCSHPETIKEWSQTDEKFQKGLEKMLAVPSLVRAARFIALNVGNDFIGNMSFHYKWDWE
ncbi:MAG: hypothetical protein ACR2MD_00735 [Aridibacter sp.]